MLYIVRIMVAYVLPVVVVIASSVAYHLSQKSLGNIDNPWSVFVVAYGTALMISTVLWLMTRDSAALFAEFSWLKVSRAMIVGVAVLGIEAGFLLAYRAGWPLSSTSLLVNASVGIILALVGILGFGENVTAAKLIGLAMTMVGVALLARAE